MASFRSTPSGEEKVTKSKSQTSWIFKPSFDFAPSEDTGPLGAASKILHQKTVILSKIEERLLELELKHNASVVKLLELRANSSQLQVVVVLLPFEQLSLRHTNKVSNITLPQ